MEKPHNHWVFSDYAVSSKMETVGVEPIDRLLKARFYADF